MSVHVPAALRRAVRERAGGQCEYCRILERIDSEPFQIDHVRPLGHGGRTVAANLAHACLQCNRWKGPNLASIDLSEDAPAWLFNPRQDLWEEHFVPKRGKVIGLTPGGRATVTLFRMNDPDRVRLRIISLRPAGTA